MLSPANSHNESFSGGDHGGFLHRAAHDLHFRALLESDPQAALAEHGLSVDLEQIPSEVKLPSAGRIQGVLADTEEEEKKHRIFPWMPLISA